MQGKILIINKTNGGVLGWFGETFDDSRPRLEDIALLELEPNQYQDDFTNLVHGINGIKVVDLENKTLKFDTTPPPPPEPTYEELQQQLLQAKGVI